MNLIISGDNPKNLAKIEALAKEMGLVVSRELTSSGTGKMPRRRAKTNAVETKVEKPESSLGKTSHEGGGPLYGIE